MKTITVTLLLAVVMVGCVSTPRQVSTTISTEEIRNAAMAGDVARFRAFLTTNPNVINSKDNHGVTPLHVAAWSGQKAVALLLLTHGADVNAKTAPNTLLPVPGSTPLNLAVAQGRKDITELLLAHGANVNSKDGTGRTPLHQAGQRGQKDLTEFLLVNGANVNAKDNNGNTPLHSTAASYFLEPEDIENRKEVVELLLAHGADVNAKNGKGRTPLYCAASGHRAVAEFLRQHGGIGGYKQPAYFECRAEQVFYVDKQELYDKIVQALSTLTHGEKTSGFNFGDAIPKKDFGNEYYKILPAYILVMTIGLEPKPEIRGDDKDSLKNPHSMFQCYLQQFKPNNHRIVIFLRANSLKIFHQVREIMKKRGFDVTWELLDEDEPIKIGTGSEMQGD